MADYLRIAQAALAAFEAAGENTQCATLDESPEIVTEALAVELTPADAMLNQAAVKTSTTPRLWDDQDESEGQAALRAFG